MKAIPIRRMVTAFCLLLSICIFSCKKEGVNSTDSTNSSSVTTTGDDQAQVSGEADIVSNDANTALNGQSDFSGSLSSTASSSGASLNSVNSELGVSSLINIHQLICDATITYDTANGLRVITIKYDGPNCWGNRTRTGTVTITMPKGQHWKDAGATATVTIDSLKITRNRDGKSIVLSGNKIITNLSGGLLKDLSSLQTITHTITGSLQILFESGLSRNWNVSKKRVFTYDNGIVVTTTGTYSDGTNSNIAEWGTNRFDETFTSMITVPKVIRQDCDFRLVSGQNTLITGKGSYVITYGLDSNGEPTGCPGTGTYYYKLVYTGVNGKIYTIIFPY